LCVKASKGIQIPWRLHIRSFWKIHFINPPEVQGQVVKLFVYGWKNDDPKISKSPISVNGKIADIVPLGNLPNARIFSMNDSHYDNFGILINSRNIARLSKNP